jgi:hypothetical protein
MFLVNSNEPFDSFLSNLSENIQENHSEYMNNLESHSNVLKNVFNTKCLNVNSELNVDQLNAVYIKLKSLLIKKLKFLNQQLEINNKNTEIGLNFGFQVNKFLNYNAGNYFFIRI